jgi:hypothetical protein
MQDRAFHARHELDDPSVSDVLDEAVDLGIPQFAMGHLAAAETQAGLDLVAFGQKTDGLIFLGLVVVLVERDGKLHFLDDDDLLLFARRVFTLFFFLEEATVILDAADRRDCVGRDFHQIEATLTGDLQRLEGRKNPHLLPIFVDHTDFTCTDFFVDADK